MANAVTIPMQDSSWNTRGSFWSMSLSDANGNALVSGVRLVTMFPLLDQHPGLDMPPGSLFVYDPNPATRTMEPGRSDFTGGRNLSLIYWSR
jgi:hypothetical protein